MTKQKSKFVGLPADLRSCAATKQATESRAGLVRVPRGFTSSRPHVSFGEARR